MISIIKKVNEKPRNVANKNKHIGEMPFKLISVENRALKGKAVSMLI